MATAKIQTQGFKTAVHKPMGDVTDAMSIIYTVYGLDSGLGSPHFVQVNSVSDVLLLTVGSERSHTYRSADILSTVHEMFADMITVLVQQLQSQQASLVAVC